MVAADLTLYGNPLRCLTTRKKKPEVTSGQQATEEKPKTKAGPISPVKKSSPSTSIQDKNDEKKTNRVKEVEKKRPDEGKVASSVNANTPNNAVAVDTIAADLTKYSSPLDDKI